MARCIPLGELSLHIRASCLTLTCFLCLSFRNESRIAAWNVMVQDKGTTGAPNPKPLSLGDL